jgi:hypothetical protein
LRPRARWRARGELSLAQLAVLVLVETSKSLFRRGSFKRLHLGFAGGLDFVGGCSPILVGVELLKSGALARLELCLGQLAIGVGVEGQKAKSARAGSMRRTTRSIGGRWLG